MFSLMSTEAGPRVPGALWACSTWPVTLSTMWLRARTHTHAGEGRADA